MGFLGELFSEIDDLRWGNYQTDRDWQVEQQQKQNDFNVKMWKLNNEYNNPQNQIKRLMDAGISRSGAASMLTGGESSGVTASDMPSAPNQNRVPQMLSTILGGIKEMSLLKASKENLEANTRKIISEADRNEKTLTFDLDLLKKQGDFMDKQMSEISKNMQLTEEQRKNWEILNKWADKKEEAEINNMTASYNETLQKIELLKEQKKDVSQEVIKKEWENFYRNNFGIDPNSAQMNQLITSTLKGDMDSVFNAFEKGVKTSLSHLKGIAETGYNQLQEFVNKKINNDLGIKFKNTSLRTKWDMFNTFSHKLLFGNPLKWFKKDYWSYYGKSSQW